MLGPKPEIMEFFRDYMLKGVKNLNNKERAVYTRYMELMTIDRYIVDEKRVNIGDLIHAHKPGSIVRRRT